MKFLWCAMVLMMMVMGVQARHIKGGWMNYTYDGTAANGNNIYTVTVKVYRDCGVQTPGQNDAVITITAYDNSTLQLAGTPVQANLIANYQLNKTTFSECINPVPQVCYVILEYRTLIQLPPSPTGYTLSFQRCCRINGIMNVAPPSDALGNTYSITIPGTVDAATNVRNNSPVFNLNDTVLVCFNSNITLDYSATDADGDSLEYFFTDAFNGASQTNPNPTTSPPPPYAGVPYAAGFGAANPFGANLLQINSRTGLITGKSPNATGEYVIAVGVREFRNGKLIATTRKELHVNVANCSIAAAELPLRITSCDGFTVTFENLNNSPAILSYFWDFGVPNRTDDTSRNARPSFTYPDTGRYVAKLIVNRESSCADSGTTEVWVYPGFFPGFSSTGSCFSNPFQFTDTSRTRYGFINYVRWDFGNTTVQNDTSLLRNPQYRYPSPGTYNVTQVVGSNLGCRDTVVVPVQVFDKPALSLAFKDTLICSIDTLQLRASGNGNFSWTPTANMLNANTATPLVWPKDTATYTVTLNENGCVASESVTVNVLDFINVDAGADTTICLTDGVAMRPITQALSFNWQPANLFTNNRIRNAVMMPTAAVTKVFVTANLGKCQARDSLTVRTVPYPQADAGSDTLICSATPVRLNGRAVGSTYSWSPSATVNQPTQLSTQANPTSTTRYYLTVFDNLGCPKPGIDSVLVTVTPPITIFAGNDTAIVYNQVLQLNAQSNAPNFRWSPGVGLSSTSINNPRVTITPTTLPGGQEAITYTLVVTDAAGCTSSDDLVVTIFKTGPSIFVPNAFTPNADGLNDVLRPVLAGVQRLEHFRIFNRYGQLVFETNTPGRGWDGRINGQLQPSGAYVFQCRAVTYEGNALMQKGTFVLVR